MSGLASFWIAPQPFASSLTKMRAGQQNYLNYFSDLYGFARRGENPSGSIPVCLDKVILVLLFALSNFYIFLYCFFLYCCCSVTYTYKFSFRFTSLYLRPTFNLKVQLSVPRLAGNMFNLLIITILSKY